MTEQTANWTHRPKPEKQPEIAAVRMRSIHYELQRTNSLPNYSKANSRYSGCPQ